MDKRWGSLLIINKPLNHLGLCINFDSDNVSSLETLTLFLFFWELMTIWIIKNSSLFWNWPLIELFTNDSDRHYATFGFYFKLEHIFFIFTLLGEYENGMLVTLFQEVFPIKLKIIISLFRVALIYKDNLFFFPHL